jgi:hypothetical protein
MVPGREYGQTAVANVGYSRAPFGRPMTELIEMQETVASYTARG